MTAVLDRIADTAGTTGPNDVTAAPDHPADSPAAPGGARRVVRLLGTLVMAAGLVLVVSGGATWALTQTSLADERITVAEDAAHFGGEPVDGPLTAYYQADIIEHHALEASEGKTYAELAQDDPRRAMVMNGSFLRASLFTSVLAFGVSAMAVGLGVLFGIVGYALRRTAASV